MQRRAPGEQLDDLTSSSGPAGDDMTRGSRDRASTACSRQPHEVDESHRAVAQTPPRCWEEKRRGCSRPAGADSAPNRGGRQDGHRQAASPLQRRARDLRGHPRAVRHIRPIAAADRGCHDHKKDPCGNDPVTDASVVWDKALSQNGRSPVVLGVALDNSVPGEACDQQARRARKAGSVLCGNLIW